MTDHPHTTIEAAEFHVLRVEREVNSQLGGDATITDLVRLMIDMGWTPPNDAHHAG